MRNRIFEFDGEEGSFVGEDDGGDGTAMGDTDPPGQSNDADTDTDLGGGSSGGGGGGAGGDGTAFGDAGYILQPADPEAPGFRVYRDPITGQQTIIDDKGRYWYSPNADTPATVVYTPEEPGKETAWGNAIKKLVFNPDGSLNVANLAKAGAGIAALRSGLGGNLFSPNTVGGPQGYTGTIPTKKLVREQIPYEADPTRRPGAGGRRYFTSTQYVAPDAAAAARTAAQTEAAGIAALAKPKPVTAPVMKEPPDTTSALTPPAPAPASDVINLLPVPKPSLAQGGVATLARGRYLNGATDGMADQIPANIEGKQEARLSHGEFVIPADVVSHLGNGNSDAGAQRLYDMMDKIRKARTGTPKQGKQINPDKFIPSRG